MIYNEKFKVLRNLIGNTPLICIQVIYKKRTINVYAKLEWYNFTGSIKDRVIIEILENSYKQRLFDKNFTFAEVTSGNTGISLAGIGAYLGNKVEIIMPEYMSEERKKILLSYGANLKLISEKEGGFLKCLDILEKLPNKNYFKTRQFENEYNLIAQQKTAKEIIKQARDINIEGFVSGVGTGGTLIGIGKELKNTYENLICCAIEPASSPVLKTNKKTGKHKIEGISDEFIPKLYDKNIVDCLLDITDEEAISTSQYLCNNLGIGVGISSGANFIGSIKLALEKDINNVVTIFPDDNKKYVSTDLMSKRYKNIFLKRIKSNIIYSSKN